MPNKLRRPTTGCSARLTPHVDSLPGGSYHEAPTGSPTQAAINTFPKALGVAGTPLCQGGVMTRSGVGS